MQNVMSVFYNHEILSPEFLIVWYAFPQRWIQKAISEYKPALNGTFANRLNNTFMTQSRTVIPFFNAQSLNFLNCDVQSSQKGKCFTASTRDTTVKPKKTTEPMNPITQAKILGHEFFLQGSSPAPHPQNFVMKHMPSFKCAPTLQALTAMNCQLGVLVTRREL